MLRRLSAFNEGNTFLSSSGPVSIELGGVATEAVPEARLANGSLLMTTVPAGPGTEAVTYLLRGEGNGAEVLARLHWGRASQRIQAGNLRTLVKLPVEEISAWAPGPDGSWLAILHRPLPEGDIAEPPRLLALSQAGDTLWTRTLPHRREPISRELARAEIVKVAEDYAHALRRLGTSPRMLADAFEAELEIPEYQSPFDRLAVGGSGEIWLREGAFGKGEARWWILDSQGKLLGHARLPTRYEVLAIGSDRVFARSTGEYGEPVLVLLRRR